MPTQSIPIGPPVALVQNQIYALPAVLCTLFSSSATPTIQVSNDVAFGTNVALTLTAGAAQVAGGFLRATTANTAISLKRA